MKENEVRDQQKMAQGKIEVLKLILQNINEDKIDAARTKINSLIEAESLWVGVCEGAIANSK